MSDLKSRLANLSPAQRAELLKKLNASGSKVEPSLPLADRSQPLPLSFAQQRLWFLEQLEGATAAYNMPAAFRLLGVLRVDALEQALNAICQRHEILRTRLVEDDGAVQQVIDAWQARALPLRQVNEGELAQALQVEASQRFDLAREHPLRLQLFRLDAAQHVLAITVHHIASDGWSTGVMMGELAALYNAACRSETAALLPLPLQYADFAAWQVETLADEAAVAKHLDFWRNALSDTPAAINLPTDFARTAQPVAAGDNVYFQLDAATSAQVAQLASAQDATSYMVLLAAFYAVLARWSGDADITVGSPIANRPRKELEGLIGFFVNTLALRARPDMALGFAALLQQVRQLTLDAYAHAELPFEHLVEKLKPERRLNQSPYFQIMFAMQSGGDGGAALDGLQVEGIATATGAARLDLTLSLNESAQGIAGCLEFATSLFRKETAQRLTEHFRNLLAAALRDPATPLAQLEMLSQAERHRLLVTFNRTDTERDRSLCLHQAVERQAAKTPDAIALRHDNSVWTYRQLLDASSQISALLQSCSVSSETLVGVCLDRTPTLIAAMLGILRAGCAYVALDPAYPVERLHYVLNDAAATIVLTQSDYAETIFSGARPAALREVIALNRVALPAASAAKPVSVPASQLAYVLYTSGSTGRPKGVAIEHRSPAALIDWARSVFAQDALRGVLAGTSICFDLSIFEIFLPLSVGGSVILADNVLALPEVTARNEVTLINTVPSAIDALLRQDAIPASVQVVNLAGEPLTTELADRVYAVPSVGKVYDLYGPSEDTTYSTYCLRLPGAAPSIGQPIANTKLFILDKALQPVPIGVPGEIYLAGEGLARGYLGRPDLTDERFIAAPFPGVGRMYRTGDLARFRPDGFVEYLGRIDHQVKLRGFRIELGEIENALRDYPGVAACVVLVREGRAGNPRLVGYVAHADGPALAAALQAHLQTRLPDYMIPAALVVLPKLPLNPNGKIDRAALPDPESQRPTASATSLSAEAALLATIWQDLLGVEQVGADDDFFALGGHSLLATRLLARMRSVFQVDIGLRGVFEQPTLRQQAQALARQRKVGGLLDSPIPQQAERERLPLSFAQERLWFLDQLDEGNTAYNMPGAIRLRGQLDLAALAQAFSRLVARHESLRTVFPAHSGEAFAAPGPLPSLAQFDWRDLSPEAQAEAVAAYLAADANQPFDLAAGPLLRASVLLLADDDWVLSCTLHHIIADGWSVGLLLSEWAQGFADALAGSAPQVGNGLQYGDFAAWQRSRFAAGDFDAQLAHWRDQLDGAPALLNLPTAAPRPPVQTHAGASHTLRIPAASTKLLQQRNRELGVTSFMTLLASYGLLLGHYAAQDEVVIGFPSAGRNRADLEGVIGMFVNTLPLRLSLPGSATFTELLQQTRERTLQALSQQDLPFSKLVDELGVTRSLAYSPVFQAMFILQNTPQAAVNLSGITLESIEPPNASQAKFDLTLAIAESGDELVATFEYNRDLFSADSIASLATRYLAVLQQALAVPTSELGALVADLAITRQHTVADIPRLAAQLSRAPRSISVGSASPLPSADNAEQALLAIWRDVLHLDAVGLNDNFFALGGDSILSIQVIARLREAGWSIKPKDVFRHQTISELAAVAQTLQQQVAEADDSGKTLALTPAQQQFFALQVPSPQHFNQAVLLRLRADVDRNAVQAALSALQQAHPAWRSRFACVDGTWQQIVMPSGDLSLAYHDLAAVPAGQRSGYITEISQAAQRRLHIENGPLLQAALFADGQDDARLLLIAHHLVVDAVSWHIALADLENAYWQAASGKPAQLAAEPCSLSRHRQALAQHATSPGHAAELAYWHDVLRVPGQALATLAPRGPSDVESVTLQLDAARTRLLLTDVHSAYNTNVADLLLAALGYAAGQTSGREQILVDLEGHGRNALGEELDLSRSIGWFTTLYPVALPGSGDLAASLRSVKESTRRVPHGGLGFGLANLWQGAPQADICFNYLGQAGAAASSQLFHGIAPESPGDQTAADFPRRYRLECTASVVNEQLMLHFGIDTARLDASAAESIANATLAQLGALIDHCLTPGVGAYTPSDFSDVALQQDELDDLLGDLDLSAL